MGNSSSTPKISAQDRAILDMKIQRDKLQLYQKKISILTARETSIAKECLLQGKKEKALLALRRKKYQESLLSQTDAQLEQLQRLASDVEFASVQKDVMYGLEQGTKVLKQIHAEMGGMERVDRLLEENAEARAYEREISEMLGGQLSNQDEDEVEDELEALERETAKKVEMPNVPATEVETEQRAEQIPAKDRAKAREARRAQEMLAA